MSNQTYCVFTLADSRHSSIIRYAGLGLPPAFLVELWRDRAKVQSPLNQWLSSLDAIPKAEIIAQGLSLYQAEELLAVVRQRLKADNADLLSSRPSDSFVTGGGKPLAVFVDGQPFDSIREASRSLGVSVATISRRVNGDDPNAYKIGPQLKEFFQ